MTQHQLDLIHDSTAFRLESPRPSHSWGYGFHVTGEALFLAVFGLTMIFGGL